MSGTVYLLCFDRPLAHARHYLGWTASVDGAGSRVDQHLTGAGSKLMSAVVRAGIGAQLTRTWEGDRSLERALKNRKNSRGLCPRCLESYNRECADRMRRLRAQTKESKSG